MFLSALNMRSDWFFLVLITFWQMIHFIMQTIKTSKKAVLWQGNRMYDAVVKFDTYRNLQHRTVLPATARLSCWLSCADQYWQLTRISTNLVKSSRCTLATCSTLTTPAVESLSSSSPASLLSDVGRSIFHTEYLPDDDVVTLLYRPLDVSRSQRTAHARFATPPTSGDVMSAEHARDSVEATLTLTVHGLPDVPADITWYRLPVAQQPIICSTDM